ncbi:MAG: hypothetical protein LBQ11_00575, partial [Candidatus Nomurabacteria bacterium]|nr:hypothetical protein [Candidatus Nomurabacteria bacterium]
MAKTYYQARTPRWQRITIWIIAIAMAGGTLVGFFFMAIATKNPDLNPAQIAAKKEGAARVDFDAKMQEYEERVNAEFSQKYFAELNGYKSQVAPFEPTGIGNVKTKDLKVGDGAEVTSENTD